MFLRLFIFKLFIERLFIVNAAEAMSFCIQNHFYSRYKGPVRNIFEPIDSPGYNGQYSTGIHNSPIAGKSVKVHKIVIYFKKYTHFIRQCAEVKTNVGDTITPEQK